MIMILTNSLVSHSSQFYCHLITNLIAINEINIIIIMESDSGAHLPNLRYGVQAQHWIEPPNGQELVMYH